MAKCLSVQDLDELNIEVIRNILYKEYLQAFHKFCAALGGTTAQVMCELLEFEADRRAFNITLNSFGTDLSKDDRAKLYPKIGRLYPEGQALLKECSDAEEVARVAEFIPVGVGRGGLWAPSPPIQDQPFRCRHRGQEYKAIFDGVGNGAGEKTLEDRFYEYEVGRISGAAWLGWLGPHLRPRPAAGQAQRPVVPEPVPLRCLLQHREAEGAGGAQHCLDQRVHRPAPQVQDRQLRPHLPVEHRAVVFFGISFWPSLFALSQVS